MMLFAIKKINLIVCVLSTASLICYILFLSLSNSLDFNIEKASAQQIETIEEYEQLLTGLAETQNKDFLSSAAQELGLIETTFANGYVDIRNKPVSVGEAIVRNQ
jgi:hypothetical protein